MAVLREFVHFFGQILHLFRRGGGTDHSGLLEIAVDAVALDRLPDRLEVLEAQPLQF